MNPGPIKMQNHWDDQQEGGGAHTEGSDISTRGEGLPGPGSPPASLFAPFLPTWTRQHRQQDGRRSGWLSSNLLSLLAWLVFQECWIGELYCCFLKVRRDARSTLHFSPENPEFQSGPRVVKMVLHLWFTMWFHNSKIQKNTQNQNCQFSCVNLAPEPRNHQKHQKTDHSIAICSNLL